MIATLIIPQCQNATITYNRKSENILFLGYIATQLYFYLKYSFTGIYHQMHLTHYIKTEIKITANIVIYFLKEHSRFFTCMNSFNLRNSPMWQVMVLS